jgi:outer membrane immunogenic protein
VRLPKRSAGDSNEKNPARHRSLCRLLRVRVRRRPRPARLQQGASLRRADLQLDYIGGHVGGGFSASNNFNGLVLSDYDARFLGGVQAGADWQFAPNWVVGTEGQYSWLGKNQINAIFPAGFVYNNNQRGLGSVTGRVGYAAGPALFYVKGGYAYSDNRETLTFGGVPVAFALQGNHTHGWTVGGGIEYMFAQNWSAKAEYQYYDFGDSRFLAPAALVPFGTFNNDEHTLKLGVNYRFNFASPVAARY